VSACSWHKEDGKVIWWVIFVVFEVALVMWCLVALRKREWAVAYMAAAFACLIPIGAFGQTSSPLYKMVPAAVSLWILIVCACLECLVVALMLVRRPGRG
jgi:hypothetical protein